MDRFNNIPLTAVIEQLGDKVLTMFIEYKQYKVMYSQSDDDWQRISNARIVLNGQKVDTSCGTCKISALNEIVEFLTYRGYFFK